MKAYELKAHIRTLGGELKRIGRSRNWQLKIQRQHIINIILLIEQTDEPSWQWLAKLLRQQNADLSHEEILAIAKRNSGITINELIVKTECTIAEARKVLDELEDL